MCFPVSRGNSYASRVRPTSQSPSRSSNYMNYMMRRQPQVDEEQCEDESNQKHAEAQPEETDIAKAPNQILELCWQKSSTSQRLTSQHFVCSCRCELCHPGKRLDVLRGSHTDTECKDVNDIDDLWTNNGVKALSNRGEERLWQHVSSPGPHLVANG